MSRPRNNHFPEYLRKYSKKTLHATRVLFNLDNPTKLTEAMVINAGRTGRVKIQYTDQYKQNK